MPITIRAVPDSVESLADEQSGSLFTLDNERGFSGAMADSDNIDILPCYYLALLPIVSGTGIVAAVQVGWKSIRQTSAGGRTVEIETVSDRAHRVTRRRPISEEERAVFARSTLEVLVSGDTEVYEVRALRIPPIVNLAVWLHGAARDLVVPITNTFSQQIVRRTVYEAEELLTLIRIPCRDLLEFTPEIQ